MTFVSSIDGLLLKEMVTTGVALLEKSKVAVDALNVFPVPDGDTGTNMSLTMMAAAKELAGESSGKITVMAETVARGALKGARGNSGVILSQLYRGFARGLEGLAQAGPKDFARALRMGADAAYKAVMKPKEGTILTVARYVADKACEYAEAGGDIYGLLENMLVWGEDILARTPDMLPVLKQAGVVDAGGKGLMILYVGYKMAVDGESVDDADFISLLGSPAAAVEIQQDDSIEFGYCTEYLVQNLKAGVAEEQVARLREKLSNIGDSVIVVGDLGMIKVHVHSNDPGKAIQYGISLGSLTSIKVDNMREQHRHIVLEEGTGDEEAEVPIDKGYGIVSICSGDGLAHLMKDIGASEIVTGGQTMNPSTDDILRAARRTGGKDVYLLPNNSNVILAAQQAAELADEQALHLIPTRTVPQGVAALIAFMPDSGVEGNIERMKAAAGAVHTGSVTYAVRDSEMGGNVIREGDIMGLNEKIVSVVGKDVQEVAAKLIDEMLSQEKDLVTLYYGEDVGREQADALAEEVSAAHDGIDVEVVAGGQPLYYYLVSVE